MTPANRSKTEPKFMNMHVKIMTVFILLGCEEWRWAPIRAQARKMIQPR